MRAAPPALTVEETVSAVGLALSVALAAHAIWGGVL